jgi:cytochrome P450
MNSSDFPPQDLLLAAPLDPLDAVGHADPYPYYDSLAAQPGLRFDPRLQLWVASSAASVKAVLAHPDCRVRPLAEPVPAAIGGGTAGEIFGALVRMNEGERHARPKLALQRALAALPLDVAQQRAAQIGRRLWRENGDGGGSELAGWVFDVPVSTMAHLIGFTDAQLPALAAWMGRFVASLSPLSSAAQIVDAHVAAQELMASFKQLLRDGAPAEGSLLALVVAEAQALGWDDAHGLLANLVGLLSQTYEATAGAIGNSVVALVRQPEEERCEPADAATLVQAVALRDPPIQNTRRFVARACEVDGVALEAGQAILLVLAAASRDPQGDCYPFGFGYGPHACPGHKLACAIAAGALEIVIEHACTTAGGADFLQALRWNYRRSLNARVPEFSRAA